MTAPTQTRYPWRAALRTAVQAAPTVVTVIPLVVVAIEGDHPGLLGPIGAGGIAIAAGAARVMAIPQVNEWLSRFNLGAQPTGRHAR